MTGGMQNQDDSPSRKRPAGAGNEDGVSSGSDWSRQINESFMFSPYWGASGAEPLSVSSIHPLAEAAEDLLNRLGSDESLESEFHEFAVRNADKIMATVIELSFDEERTANLVTTAFVRAQRRIGEFGEVSAAELSATAMLPSTDSIRPLLGGTATAIMALSVGDASSALAAQRGGLSSEIGRGIIAAELILELRDIIHSRL